MYCQKYLARCQTVILNSSAVILESKSGPTQTVGSNKGYQALILGLPGKYKKRLAENLARTFHLSHLSIPQVVSGHLRRNSSFDKIIKVTAKTGLLLPDNYVVKFVKQSIASLNTKSFVITGFPSTLNQAYLFWKEVKLDLVIYPTYPEEVLVKFLLEDLDPPTTDAEKLKRLIDARQTIKKQSKRIQTMLTFYEKQNVLFKCYSETEDGAWEKVKQNVQSQIAVYN